MKKNFIYRNLEESPRDKVKPGQKLPQTQSLQAEIKLSEEIENEQSVESALINVFPALFGIEETDNLAVSLVTAAFIEAMRPVFQGLADQGYKFKGFNPTKENLTWYWEIDGKKVEEVLPLDQIKPYTSGPWTEMLDMHHKLFYRKLLARAGTLEQKKKAQEITEMPSANELIERYQKQAEAEIEAEDQEYERNRALKKEEEEAEQKTMAEHYPQAYQALQNMKWIDGEAPENGPKSYPELQEIVDAQLDSIVEQEPETAEAIAIMRNALTTLRTEMPRLKGLDQDDTMAQIAEIFSIKELEKLTSGWDEHGKKMSALKLAMEFAQPIMFYGKKFEED